jgi:hypothetical protein
MSALDEITHNHVWDAMSIAANRKREATVHESLLFWLLFLRFLTTSHTTISSGVEMGFKP